MCYPNAKTHKRLPFCWGARLGAQRASGGVRAGEEAMRYVLAGVAPGAG